MANSVDPDQTAPIGAVCFGSTLFACLLNFTCNVLQLFAAGDFSRQHFQMHFFLGALRVNWFGISLENGLHCYLLKHFHPFSLKAVLRLAIRKIEDIQMFLFNMCFISRVKWTIFIFHEWRSHK